jgi:protein-S-isoprenylcysteine O-methyltransferase Ste14
VTPLAWFLTFPPIVILGALMAAFGGGPWSATKIAGLLLVVAGYGGVTVARVQLGNAFSVSPRATTLVTHGLYARIRHPIYVFSSLGLLGLVLYFGFLPLSLLVAVAVPIQVVRARREERVLEEKFGDAYRRYRENTWF